VPAKRLLAIFDLVAEYEDSVEERHGLCLVATEVLRVSGAAIALTSKGQPWTLYGSSSETTNALLDVETTVGEGPCTDALASEKLIEESDLSLAMNGRWPIYVPKALACGVHAVFALPVQIGVVRLGVLGLVRDECGELSDTQATDAYLLASVVAQSLLAYQAGAPRGVLSLKLQREAMFDFSVQQATGMIAVQGGFTIEDALVALKSHAIAADWGMKDLATEVISRRVRYEPKNHTWLHVGA
jgi:hypothetical protein